MSPLADHINVAARFARSANLERDITATEPLDGYVVTARALDIVARLTTTANTTDVGGAWSITGPYGSGKSSLAVLLDGVFGEAGPVRDKAIELLGHAAPEVSEAVRLAHAKHGTETHGFHRAMVTASREPVGHTLLRALHSAVVRRFGKIPSKSKFAAAAQLKEALSDAESADPRRTGPSPAALLAVARCLAEQSPLLIVVDEFGKNLEAIDQAADTDPYLLQQLAEAGQGTGLPIFTLTLQHLSFADYFAGSDGLEQREWAKVQGRFEDIPYVDSSAQTRALIGTVFEPSPQLAKRVRAWAKTAAKAMGQVGIHDLTDPAVIAGCYPLHPLAAAVLPELCSRYGQNERTLFSFLTGADPAAVPTFLSRSSLPARGSLPTVGLSEIYDYFVAGGVVAGRSGPQTSRWTEIATRLRDTHGLSADEAALAKAVAVLNLVSASGTLRASTQLLGMLHNKPEPILASLEARSLLTYRDFADEYRLWQGSDVNLRDHVETVATQLSTRPLIEILAAVDEPQPIIAARHSAQYDVLRVFSQRYANSDETPEPLSPFSEADGEVLLVVDAAGLCPQGPATSAKPIVAAVPTNIDQLDADARSVAALHEVLELPEVIEDWVARGELSEQLAQAEAALRASLVTTFAAKNCDWFLLTESDPISLSSGRGSAAVSAAADMVYSSAPIISNEMIMRTDLTSQGAKARRLVLEGMIERSDETDLGFEGYGPEVAIYRAMLCQSGIHRLDGRNDRMVFAAPKDPTMKPAWKAMEAEFKRARTRRINLSDIYAVLQAPPIGLKAAAVPVLVTAGLLAHGDEVAIYEHGTFKPVLGTDVSERMVKNPSHFDIKHFASANGARRELVDALAEALGVTKRFRKHRVSNVLAIVGHLVGVVGSLDNFTLNTTNLSDRSVAARDVMLDAVEPDQLLFDKLPVALGLPAVSATKPYPETEALASAVKAVVDELEGSMHALLDELYSDLLNAVGETTRLAVTGQAASLENEVLDSDVRAFVLTIANEAAATDRDWIKAIATVVSKRAVAEWSDDDRSRFDFELRPKIAAFHRLLALHAERRASTDTGFEAIRVTFTRPDGREDYRLATLDDAERGAAASALRPALQELTATLGSETRAQQALLALLGEDILPAVANLGDTGAVDMITKKTQHG